MDWKSSLTDVSLTLTKSDDLLQKFKSDNPNWLGFNGISEIEIKTHEDRLITNLPPSYEEFLKVRNGFKQLTCFVWDIFSVDKIEWIEKFDPTFYELYTTLFNDSFDATDEEYFVYGEEQKTTDFRSDDLVNSLAVSNWGDSAIQLLNSKVRFGDEWEAWMFAIWHLGPVRYKSFEELMQGEYFSYLKLRNDKD